jgi:hypothetical protein
MMSRQALNIVIAVTTPKLLNAGSVIKNRVSQRAVNDKENSLDLILGVLIRTAKNSKMMEVK